MTVLISENWLTETWDKYLEIVNHLGLNKVKSYYHNGKYKLEMSPIGNDHASDQVIITIAVSLFASLRGIPMNGKDNCTYRKTGFSEAQPDLSYYIGERANVIPWGTSIIDLDQYPPPNLVIEVANTSLPDDQGEKRLLYEDLNIDEYWIIDVKGTQIIAFKIADGGSKRIKESEVLPGLEISTLQDALQLTRQRDQSQVINRLMSKFTPMNYEL